MGNVREVLLLLAQGYNWNEFHVLDFARKQWPCTVMMHPSCCQTSAVPFKTRHAMYRTVRTVHRNVETRSCTHCRSAKAITITYSDCVFLALGIQQAMRMCSIILSVACPALQFCCRIHTWFRLMGGLQAKSMTSQRYRAVTRWRICVTMAMLWQQQDGGYMLLWKRYGNKNI